jgi:hypothetical protein
MVSEVFGLCQALTNLANHYGGKGHTTKIAKSESILDHDASTMLDMVN